MESNPSLLPRPWTGLQARLREMALIPLPTRVCALSRLLGFFPEAGGGEGFQGGGVRRDVDAAGAEPRVVVVGVAVTFAAVAQQGDDAAARPGTAHLGGQA